VLYLTNMPQVTLMPVYPMVNGEDSNLFFITDERLSESFTLEADGSPHPDFLKILDQRHLWWTNFVVLDQDSVKTLLTFSKGSNQGGLSESCTKLPLVRAQASQIRKSSPKPPCWLRFKPFKMSAILATLIFLSNR